MRTAYDVRIGEYLYRLAGEFGREYTGLPSLRWIGRSVTAQQANVVGAQNVENVEDERLRWLVTSFAAGEGQKVLIADDSISERRYDRSLGVDLSQPGQLRLGKALRQLAIGPNTLMTTVEGSVFIDQVGTSSVFGTNRRLNSQGDRIAHRSESALGAGLHQLDVWAYTAPTTEIGSARFDVIRGKANQWGDSRRMRTAGDGRCVLVGPQRVPEKTKVRIVAVVKGHRKNPNKSAKATMKLRVRNGNDSATITEKTFTLRSSRGHYDEQRRIPLTFQAKAGAKYRYRLELNQDDGDGVDFWDMEEHILDPAKIKVEVMQGGSAILQRTVDISGITESARVLSATFSMDTGSRVTFRVTRLSDSVKTLLDDIRYSDVLELKDSYNLELGQGGAVWLVDRDPVNPASVFKWDPATSEWTEITTVGPANGAARAMAHSDSYEYILMGNGVIFRVLTTADIYTQAVAGTNGVGIAVGADRLWLLTESVTGGTVLHRASVDETALPAALTAVYTPVPKGITPNLTLPRRIAGTPTGCVFFVNKGTKTSVYDWNEGSQTGRMVDEFPGFQGRAITYGRGFAFLAGEQPAPGGGTKAALFAIDLSTGPAASDQIRLPFERMDEEDSYLQDVQMYGESVYVLAHVVSDPPKIRLWRVSLADPGGLFLDHEAEVGEGAVARAMAVSDRTSVMASDEGGPWVAQDEYVSDGSAFLRTSLYNFKLLEEKRLIALIVDGEFPEGTSMELFYSANGQDFLPAGTWEAPERQNVGDIEEDVTFRNLALELRPKTSDALLTPTIYSIEVVAASAFREQIFDMLLSCQDQNSVWHVDGTVRRGAEGADYLRDLIAGGIGLVEMEDKFTNPNDSRTYLVELREPQAYYIDKGEAVIRVQAVVR